MDIAQAAKFFDHPDFENYDFSSGTWIDAFSGQLKLADKFTTIWNRPTRKRNLYTAPDSPPTSAVIRVIETGEIFMLGTGQHDVFQGGATRVVYGLHKTKGVATHRRLTPTPGGGWATNELVQVTFGDVELRSVNENQDVELQHYGHYFMFLPSNSTVEDGDTVELDGLVYTLLEVYPDSGLVAARVSAKPEERVNVVYTVVGPSVYDPNTRTNTPTLTPYNVTAKIEPLSESELQGEYSNAAIKFMVESKFITVSPKINDRITYSGKTYKVMGVDRDSVSAEWSVFAAI